MADRAEQAPPSVDVDDTAATPKVVALRRGPVPEGAAPHHAPGAHRRHLALAFVDLVDSTALATRLDPEDLQEVLGRFHAIVVEAVGQLDGRVVRVEGDGALACFGWPSAHEDDAERAVRASLAAIAAVGRLRIAAAGQLACRAGIATGTVVVVEQPDGPAIYGDALHLASRLHAFGPPGGLVLADAARRALGDLFTFASLGARQPKGSATPVEAWLLVGEGAGESRFEALRGPAITPLVGRRQELALLLQRWRQAKTGRGQVILLSGEAGIGKSRLVEALRQRLAGDRHRSLDWFCSPLFTDTALYPARRMLERAAGLHAGEAQVGEAADRRRERLAAVLTPAAGSAAEAAAVLADLLAIADDGGPDELTPQQRQERTAAVLLDQLAGLAAQGPVLFVCEDLHWADPSTVALLGRVAERAARLPMLLVLTSRPEPAVRAAGFGSTAVLGLHRLGRGEAAAMLAETTGGRTLEPEIARSILDRAEGVPLYLEELARAVLAAASHPDRESAAVPVSLQGSLLAQLDRLSGAKEVAQLGAVLGREFRRDVLAAVTGIEDRLLGQALQRLVVSGLLRRTGSGPEEAYAFRHALLRDAAYESLLRSRRRELHAHIVTVLERSFFRLYADYPEVLAHHCAMAGLARQAIDYRCRAGERAVRRFANAEAIEHYRHALGLLADLPDGSERDRTELVIQTAMGVPLMAAKGYSAPELRQAYDRAHALCRAVDTGPALFPVLFGLSLYYLVRSELQAARPLVARCVATARAARDDGLVLESCCLAGPAEVYRGRFHAARQVLDRGMALFRPERHGTHGLRYGQDPVGALGFIARVEGMLGRPDRAGLRCAELRARLREPGLQPNSVAVLHAQLAHAHLLLREAPAALEHGEGMVSVASGHGLPLWLGLGRMYRGAALVETGLIADDHAVIARGLADGAEGLAIYHATGALLDVPSCLCWFAAGNLRLGELDAASRQLDEARGVIARTGQAYFAAEQERLAGELSLRRDADRGAAQAWSETALSTARRQGARLLELRAVTSLARLHREDGPDAAAWARLRSLCDHFPNDAPCRDVAEAWAMLDAGGAGHR